VADIKPEAVSPDNNVVSDEATTQKNISMDLFVDIEKAHYTFPAKLMDLLEEGKVEDALFWLPGGHAFGIRPKIFFEVVLSKYFQGTKYESFTRKLNRWGFRRLANQGVAKNTVAYYNLNFKQGQPELLKKMRSGNRTNYSSMDSYHHSAISNPFPNSIFATLQNTTEGRDLNPLREFLKQQSIVSARQVQANTSHQAILHSMKPQTDSSLSFHSSCGFTEALNALQQRARLRTVQQLAMSNHNSTAAIDRLRNIMSNAKANLIDAASAPNLGGLNPQLAELMLLRARLTQSGLL
jgi:hypothetical protein